MEICMWIRQLIGTSNESIEEFREDFILFAGYQGCLMEFGSDFYSLTNYQYVKCNTLSLVQYNLVFNCLIAYICIFCI